MTAALDLRAHSAWAALVTLAGPKASPSVVDRRHMERDDRKITHRIPLASREEIDAECGAG